MILLRGIAPQGFRLRLQAFSIPNLNLNHNPNQDAVTGDSRPKETRIGIRIWIKVGH